MSKEQTATERAPWVAPVVGHNIQRRLNRRRAEGRRLGWQQHLANAIPRFAGSMAFVYLHRLVYALGNAVNAQEKPITT